MYTVKATDVQEVERLNARVRLVVTRNTFPGLEAASQGMLSLDPGAAMKDHVHEKSIEIFYPVSGKAVLVINGEEYLMEPGIAACVPKGVGHYLRNDSQDTAFQTIITHVPHL